MARVFVGHVLTFKHVPQVSTAIRALDLGTEPISIENPRDCTREVIVKAGPSAPAVEFCCCRKKRIVAAPAHVCALFKEVIVLARERPLRAFALNHVCFFVCERIPLLHMVILWHFVNCYK